MFESLCQSAHEKLIAGKCPWCRHIIADGRDVEAAFGDIVVKIKRLDETERLDAKEVARFAKEMVPLLYTAMTKGDTTIRKIVATSLGRMGPDAKKTTLPLLSLLLHDEDEAVRYAAEEAINRINQRGNGKPE